MAVEGERALHVADDETTMASWVGIVQPRRVRIGSRSKIQLPTTSATPNRSGDHEVADEHLLHRERRLPAEEAGDGDRDDRDDDEAADLLRGPRVVHAALTMIPSRTLSRQMSGTRVTHRDQPDVAEDEPRQARIGDRAVHESVEEEDHHVASTAGVAAAIALPMSSSLTSIGVASCGSSERASSRR